MNNVFLSLGGNIGNRRQNLAMAIRALDKAGCIIKKCSAIYQTQPWGVSGQPDYFNQVVELLTPMNAETLMQELLSIEKSMGRIRSKKYSARTIDMDILFFNDDKIKTPAVTIPHPRLHERRFVLEPMVEIAADFLHPVLNRTMKELLRDASDRGIVVLAG